ncbi:MAG: hypothetical protein ACR2N3_02845 [Pyrinomonadaceae bacterium]
MMVSRKQFVKIFTFAVLTSVLFWTSACSDSAETNGNVNSNVSNQTAGGAALTKDDIDELSAIIRLPETPEEVVWREEETANPKGKKLTAILKFNPESAAKIVESAAKIKPAAPTEIGTENWFPNELTAQSQLSGNESLKGISYAANDFYNPPYTNGKLTKVNETNYFVLELTTY